MYPVKESWSVSWQLQTGKKRKDIVPVCVSCSVPKISMLVQVMRTTTDRNNRIIRSNC